MSIQYLSNEKGQITAVQFPIEQWKELKKIYPNIDVFDFSLPEWQKEILDKRIETLADEPGRIKPLSELMVELE